MNAKRKLLGIGASLGIVAALAFPAMAATPTATGYCGASDNGCTQSGSQESGNCAGHGAFGAFGDKGNAPHDFSGGANADATAYNNSTLCGNPSPNSSAATLGDHTN